MEKAKSFIFDVKVVCEIFVQGMGKSLVPSVLGNCGGLNSVLPKFMSTLNLVV